MKNIAITKIKKLKTGLSKLIDYAMNPSKTTVIKDINDEFENEEVVFVRGINCTPEFAKAQMQETKDRFNKNTGNGGYDIIQSFDDNEGNNEQVFEIGCRLAEKLFGDRFEVIVALHKNTDNLHCHIVVNSVSFVDGKKFNDNKAFLNKMRNVSDRLCKEQGLSVIENPKQSKHQCYPQYIAERDGDYNKFTTLKKDIDECILRTGGEKGFIYEMQKLGYKFDFTKPHVTVNHPSYKRPVWLCDLGDEYSFKRISQRIYADWKHYRIDLPPQDKWKDYLTDFEYNYREVYVHFVTVVQTVKNCPKENYYIEKYLQKEIIKLDRLIEQQTLDDIASGKDNIDFVLAFKLSRFGRNAADVLSSLQIMQDYGVNLICVEDGIDSSKDSGKLMISVLSAVAEIERENILVQTMEGRNQKAREGKWNGGFAPYGYYLEKGELKIAEDEADTIRIIFDKYINTNMGANGIAKYLSQHGYEKKQRQNGTLSTFSAHFVKLVLDNPVYCGKLAYGRRKTEKVNGARNEYHIVKQDEYPIYDGIHDAIISEEDWLLAQKKERQQE